MVRCSIQMNLWFRQVFLKGKIKGLLKKIGKAQFFSKEKILLIVGSGGKNKWLTGICLCR